MNIKTNDVWKIKKDAFEKLFFLLYIAYINVSTYVKGKRKIFNMTLPKSNLTVP
jgi:hypothetical protein